MKNVTCTRCLLLLCWWPLALLAADDGDEPANEVAAPQVQQRLKPVKPLKPQVFYRWKDQQGATHISDKPHPGAKAIVMPRAQSFSRPKLNPRSLQIISAPNQANAAKIVIPSLTITSPANNSWLQNNQGNAVISVRLSPRLGQGQQLSLSLDGKTIGVGRSSVALKNLDRGSHTIAARVSDASGKTLASTTSIFYVRRPSILNRRRR